MPRPVSQHQHGLRILDRDKLRAVSHKWKPEFVGDGVALNSMSHPDYVDQLLLKAVKACDGREAECFARAALTVAQAISQQQFNQPKRKAKRNAIPRRSR